MNRSPQGPRDGLLYWRGTHRPANAPYTPTKPYVARQRSRPVTVDEDCYVRVVLYAQKHGITNKAALERMLEGLA